MRLITKTTILNLLLTVLVFSIGGSIIYSNVKQLVQNETDYSLRNNLGLILRSVKEGKPIEALRNNKVTIEKIFPRGEVDTIPTIIDTLIQPSYLDRLEPFRKLNIIKKISGQYYRITITDVFIESNDMSEGVTQALTQLFIFLSLVLLLFSFILSNWLFKPFEEILRQIGKFKINSSKKLELPDSSTHEFQELNHFISQMTDKAQTDYLSLKEFSENASHEMQTPIAIAKGKLEILLESPDLNAAHLKLIESAQNSLSKLSKLGQSLSLLTKINNMEFSAVKEVDFSKIVEQNLYNFSELASLKGLKLNSDIKADLKLKVDDSLADVLVGNLLKNAIRHNVENGWIKVELTSRFLKVSNSGESPKIPPHQLFERFRKSNQSGSSLGLGLAIVKKICEVNGFVVRYDFEDGAHILLVRF